MTKNLVDECIQVLNTFSRKTITRSLKRDTRREITQLVSRLQEERNKVEAQKTQEQIKDIANQIMILYRKTYHNPQKEQIFYRRLLEILKEKL